MSTEYLRPFSIWQSSMACSKSRRQFSCILTASITQHIPTKQCISTCTCSFWLTNLSNSFIDSRAVASRNPYVYLILMIHW